MALVAFSAPVEPRGKGRPRATTRGGYARMFTDSKTRAYESLIEFYARQAMGTRKPLEGPLTLELRCRMSIPKSTTKRRRGAILAGTETYYGPFDADNLLKACGDAMNGVCYLDDRQIMSLSVVKIPAEIPGVDVRISEYVGEEK